MKHFGISIIVILILTSVSLGQSRVTFGLEADAAIPTGTSSDKYRAGYGAGALVILPASSTSFSIVLGGDYLNMPGKTKIETQIISIPGYSSSTTITTHYSTLQLVSIYAGPKYGDADGVYFLPAISVNFSSETRFGIYLGGGILIPLESIKLNLGARYGFLNLVGKSVGEESESGILIFAGIVF